MCKLRQFILLISCVFLIFLMVGCTAIQQKNTETTGMQQKPQDARLAQAQELFQSGREHQKKNELIEAVNVYERVIELAPDHYEAYNNLGMIYFALGEDELGIQFFNEAIRLAPMESFLHNNLGYALLKRGYNSEAAGAFERALQLDPENIHARNNLKSAYQQMGCNQNEPCGQWQEPRQP